MSKRVIAVQICGQEYRIRSDEDEASLQRMAGLVDDSMSRIAERTGTVDTLQVAVLTSLNLARDLLALRGRAAGDAPAGETTDPERLRGLIELAESGLMGEREEGELTPLLTVPAGHEVDDTASDLLGTLTDETRASAKAPSATTG